jgi:Zn-dependent protease with chaperone function
MNFFEHQDQARRQTGQLILLFGLAVIGLVLVIYGLLAMVMVGPTTDSYWSPNLFSWVAVGVISIVGLGSLFKIAALRSGGGHAVAESLGGQPIDPSTIDAAERRLLNVVEEMAIASGVPTPAVYLLADEQGINAFAAGFRTENAVIGVTQGCVKKLTRSQLQGVIAHEFSHILNGDMRLNIQLMGAIFGILVLSIIGRTILYTARVRSFGSRKNDASGALILGLALLVAGSLGVLFGRLIQAAISRQREFLADASAVQFTRDPDGIAGALKAIGAHAQGAQLQTPAASQASHMLFGGTASHPPLEERIRRLDPSWDGNFGKPPQTQQFVEKESAEPATQQEKPSRPWSMRPGSPTPTQLAFATQLMQSVPDQVLAGAREGYRARAVIYCLLLSTEPTANKQQWQRLSKYADPAVLAETKKLAPSVAQIDIAYKLSLVELSIPALRELSPSQRGPFFTNMELLIAADKKVSLFEWALFRIVVHHLESVDRPRTQTTDLRSLADPCSVLLSAMIHFGVKTDMHSEAWKCADSALKEVNLSHTNWSGNWESLDSALAQLSTVRPAQLQALIDTCFQTMDIDGHIPRPAIQLLRATCTLLGCPMPPV